MLRAQKHQPGKAAHAGHREIEQDQIDLATLVEQFGHVLEGAGFGNVGPLDHASHGLAKRAAEQRVGRRQSGADSSDRSNSVLDHGPLPAGQSRTSQNLADWNRQCMHSAGN